MKLSRSVWIAIAILVVWLLLGWFLGSWIGLKSPVIWYLRLGLWFIGIAGFVGYLLLRPKAQGEALQGASAAAGNEIDFNFNEASKRIQAATGIKQLNSLPAVFLLGDAGSAKTSIMAQSGIEPQLLAGLAVQQDGSIAPTRTVNLWYSRNTLFIDPSGGVVADPGTRRKLFKKFVPVRLNSLLAAKHPPTRSVLFSLDCETFLQAGGAEAIAAKAREFQAVLSELSQELGASFPVYVLFTKADKIPYFREFVESLNEQEAAEVLGVSLPLPPSQGQGGYAEQQMQRLTNAFQSLYYSLADKRPIYLAREYNPANLPNIYEFPREFGKLRPLLVQFLVDLCRPSQLGTSPFLRGFYFTGVRPITISDVTPASQMPIVEDQPFDAGATRMFNLKSRSAPMAAEVREPGARKIPQWIFLQRIFPEIVLADRVGTSVAQSNVKVNFARRMMLAAAALLALLMAGWWFVSYRNNSTMAQDAIDAAQSVPAVNLSSGQLASSNALQRLTHLKDTLAVLNGYEKNGAPFSYRALLYTGSAMREPLRVTYYALFRRLLLAPTQETLMQICAKPDAYDTQGYRYIYDSLKSYLITTNHPEKSTQEFLTPNLTLHWKKDQTVDGERENLAHQNFQFYTDDLPTANPYPNTRPDSTAVETARAYLKRFAQEERIYQTMLQAAGDKLKPIIFNSDHPGTSETVINSYKVEPAFTKAGYANFQKQLADPDRYLSGEEWVLGKEGLENYDKSKVLTNLKAKYHDEFLKTWRSYLVATSVVGYASVPDAAHKLEKLGGPQSALLLALCVASENTASASKEVKDAFQPVQFVTPPGCSQQLVGPAVNPYAAGLAGLSNSLKAVGPIGNADPNNVAAANQIELQAENAASNLGLSFQADPANPQSPVLPKTAQLLKDPLIRVPPLLKGGGLGPANQAGASICDAIRPLLKKYPFNPHSTADATLQEVNGVLKPPDGALWTLYNGSPLKQFLVQAGGDYIPAPGAPGSVTPSFLNFFNRAAHMSQAMYHGDAPNPSLNFTMQALPSPDVDHITLTIDGTTLSADPRTQKSQSFVWPGATQGVSLQVRFGGSAEFTIVQATGLWAIWHFLDTAEHSTGNELQWVQRTTGVGVTMINGHPAAVRLGLDPQSAQIVQPQYFGNLSCPSPAVAAAK